MGKHSYTRETVSRHPVLVTPGASYAERMNERLAPTHVTIETPRRFRFFTRARAVVLAVLAATSGLSVSAIAAPLTTASPVTQQVSEQNQPVLRLPNLTPNAEDVSLAGQSVSFVVTIDGVSENLVTTSGITLGEALYESKVDLRSDDVVSLSLSTPVTEGLEVTVSRVETDTVNETFTSDFKVKEEENSALPEGERKVVTKGQKGEGLRTYHVEYLDGKEVSRNLTVEVITKPAVDEVVEIGTKPKASESSSSVPKPSGASVSGTKADWMAAAGIPESDWPYVDYIVNRESSWNPNAVNASSGACGLAQALPCSKVPGDWSNPVDSLRWQYSYVNSRYGGYAGAVAHSQATGWY